MDSASILDFNAMHAITSGYSQLVTVKSISSQNLRTVVRLFRYITWKFT